LKKKFSEKVKDLELIVEKLNSNIELEDAVSEYEKGIKLANSIKKYLMNAEKKIDILSKDGCDSIETDDL